MKGSLDEERLGESCQRPLCELGAAYSSAFWGKPMSAPVLSRRHPTGALHSRNTPHRRRRPHRERFLWEQLNAALLKEVS